MSLSSSDIWIESEYFTKNSLKKQTFISCLLEGKYGMVGYTKLHQTNSLEGNIHIRETIHKSATRVRWTQEKERGQESHLIIRMWEQKPKYRLLKALSTCWVLCWLSVPQDIKQFHNQMLLQTFLLFTLSESHCPLRTCKHSVQEFLSWRSG